MKHLFVLIGLVLFVFIGAQAQEKLAAKSSGGIMTIEHIVQPKESLYSLARKYKVSVTEIADINKFDKDKSLIIAEKIIIPLNADNFNQTDKKGIPVYYTVISGGELLDISKKFNNVPVKELRSWNNLKKDELTKGQEVVVGYVAGEKTEIAAKTEKPKTETAKVVKEEKPKAEPKETIKTDKEIENAVAEKLTAKKEQEVTAKKTETPLAADNSSFFKKAYEAQTNPSLARQKDLQSGIFTTDKGWNDGKYYVLMDGVAAGTIVKISNPANNKSIYAKVLGQMRGISENEGYDVRISDSAAALLDYGNADNFTVKVTY